MEYEDVVDRVADRAGVSREHAATLTEATLNVLADRISGGQALDLAAMLPDELARHLRRPHQKQPKMYDFDEFVGKVRARADDVPRTEIRPGIRAVMLTLRELVGEKEFRDALAQLPDEVEEFLREDAGPRSAEEETAEAAASLGLQPPGPDPGPARDDDLVQRTARQAGVPTEEAAQLTQATLEVLGDRIGGQPAHDLAQRLPGTSGQWLDEPPEAPAHEYGADDFVERVRDLVTEVPDDDIIPGIRAVIIALRDAVGEAELEIALRPLTDDYDELVRAA